MKKVKLAAYRKTFNMAPYELYEFAEGAEDISDCPELQKAASGFVRAKGAFEAALDKYDIEIG